MEGYIIGAIQTYKECTVSREEAMKRLSEKFSLSAAEVEKYMKEYWK